MDIANSRSLTEFQRNARKFIDGINKEHQPLLLTINGRVSAVLVDPSTFQAMEENFETAKLITAIAEGETAISEGRTRPAELVLAEVRAKYGL